MAASCTSASSAARWRRARLSVDATAALAIPGVVGMLHGRPMFRATICFGVVVMDEPFLADGEVLYSGQPVAVVAAESPAALGERRKAVGEWNAGGEPILAI